MAGPEVGDVPEPDRVKPEHVVQGVMQAHRKQQPVQEGIEPGADSSHSGDGLAQPCQTAEQQRPHKHKKDRDQDRCQTRSDQGAPLPAEESQPFRQPGVLEAVVAARTYQAGDDADERILDLLKCQQCRGITHKGRSDRPDKIRIQQIHDHEPGYQRSDPGDPVFVVSHTDTDPHREQNGNVIDQGPASLHQVQPEDRSDSCHGASLHGYRTEKIPQPHQDAAERQTCHRDHDRFT